MSRLGTLRISEGKTYQSFIFSEENGDAGIDFADSEGYEHFGLGRGIGAWGFICVEVSPELWARVLSGFNSIGSEGLGLRIGLGVSSHCVFSYLSL